LKAKLYLRTYIVCWRSIYATFRDVSRLGWIKLKHFTLWLPRSLLIMQLRSREPLRFPHLPLLVTRDHALRKWETTADWSELRRYRIPFSQVILCCTLLLRYFWSHSCFCVLMSCRTNVVNKRVLELSFRSSIDRCT